MGSAVAHAKDTEAAAEKRAAAASLAQSLLALAQDLPGLFSDRVYLLALELRRARHSCVKLVAMALIAVILALTAWAAFWALLATIALALGMPWYGVFVLILLLNGLGVWFALSRARALVDRLALPATLRHLTLAPNPAAPPPAAPEDAGLSR